MKVSVFGLIFVPMFTLTLRNCYNAFVEDKRVESPARARTLQKDVLRNDFN
jgi:hypothetical protein